MTRHLNVWVTTDNALFDRDAWNGCTEPDLEIKDLYGQRCAALDMAARTDLAAAVSPFPEEVDGETQYKLFAEAWLPGAAANADRNPLYVQWAQEGANSHPGRDGRLPGGGRLRTFDLRACACDPYTLMQMSQRLQNDGYPMKECRASTLNFSEPTKLLDALRP